MYVYVYFMLSLIALYRLNKIVFRMVYEENCCKSTIPYTIRLLSALRFLAIGSSIANDINLSMGRSALYKMLWNVLYAI